MPITLPAGRPSLFASSTRGGRAAGLPQAPAEVSPLQKYISAFETKMAAANKANEARYQQAMTIFDEIIGRYGPGGGYMAGGEAILERTKVRDVAAGMQNLVSSGLAGTTMAAGIGKKWEEEVGVPERFRLEDIRMERLSQAQLGKAGAMERREDVGPDLGLMAGLVQGAQGAVSGGGFIAGGGGDLPGFGSIGGGRGGGTPRKAYVVGGGGAGGPYGGTGGAGVPLGGEEPGAYYGAAYTPGGERGQAAYEEVGRFTTSQGLSGTAWRSKQTGNIIRARTGYPPGGKGVSLQRSTAKYPKQLYEKKPTGGGSVSTRPFRGFSY